MKILMVLDHEFPPDIRVENEIEALIEAGHEVHIACYTMKGKQIRDTHLKATVHRRTISKLIYKSSVACLKFPYYFNFWRAFLTQLFEENKFEAIHIHDLPLAKLGSEMASKYAASFTLDLHENWPALLRMAPHTQTILGKLLSSNKQWEKYELTYCKKADHIIVVVDEARERLMRMGVAADKVSVVSNTLNFDHFRVPQTKPDQDFISLLYAGGITAHRGLQFVIEGLQYLKSMPKPVRLYVLGSGSYVQQLKDKANSLGLDENIHFEGWKNFEEMQTYFGKADICLIPHIKSDHTDSTIPHKLFQHMYAGKPTVASNCKPIERILTNTQSGLTYAYNDPKDFAACIKKITRDPDLFASLQSNGIKAVTEVYNWQHDKKVLQAIYAKPLL